MTTNGVSAPRLSESEIQRQITDWLTLSRVFWYRQNSGAIASSHKGKRRFVRFARPGACDLVAVIGGRYIGIEVKRAGEDQSQAQREFQAALVQAQGVYILAHRLEDVIDAATRLRSGTGELES